MRLNFLATVIFVAACSEDDPASRDYADTACPAPIPPDPGEPLGIEGVCDRGRGYSPRYVTIQACLNEVRRRPGPGGWGLNSTSPLFTRCRPGVYVYTIDDVRNGQGLVSY